MSQLQNSLSSIKLALRAKQVRSQLEEMRYLKSEPVAIIGMGCRFPGGADSPEGFWDLLKNSVDAICEVPPLRWNLNEFYDPEQGKPGKMCTRWGGFLRDRVDEFDAEFFGISPREARRMDPQQRLLLEVAFEALEDAGKTKEKLAGSATGVFVGSYNDDYSLMQYSDLADIEAYTLLGSLQSVVANRLSFLLDLRGPSLALDTACSSSLVAVHLACQSLRNEECNLALAGGVNLMLSPEVNIAFSKGGFMAPDGRCRTFDACASGFVRSEGCGVIVLKRLSDALADQDPIQAVIRGSAINQDGNSNGFTAPNGLAQQALIRTALDAAGVSPTQISYVETHGTGTPLGDPIEVEALTEALKPHDAGPPCVLGAVKSNIGHLEPAAGIAGLIKVVLCLLHEAIPPNLHFTQLNPHISLENTRFVIPAEMHPWPISGGRRLAGVSSFGVGGTNAHVVLEEAPQLPKEKLSERPPYLLVVSARSTEALKARARAMQAFIGKEPGATLGEICWTAAACRTHYEHRLAAVGATREALAEQLEAFLNGEARPGLVSGHRSQGEQPKLAFVFPGQGSQWFGMGRTLLEQEPVFRETLKQCEEALQKYVDWSLLEQLAADESTSRLNQIDVIQPALFSIQVSLASLWLSWGVRPDAVVGHSMGEVAAAHIAGVLNLDDAARIICLRSRLLRRASGRGAMAVVDLSVDQAEQAIKGLEDRLSIAVSNSARSTALSGDRAALEGLINRLEKEEVFCRWIKVDVASHSPQMDPLRCDLLKLLTCLTPRPSMIPIYSTVKGRVAEGHEFDADYWADNLRKPVLFSTALQSLQKDGHELFMEISPHPILLPAIQQGFQNSGQEGIVLPSLRRDEDEQVVMLESLGGLYTRGYPVQWNRVYPSHGHPVQLPSYPWQRERFWYEDQNAGAAPSRKQIRGSRGQSSGAPLLGQHLASSVHAGTHFWDLDLTADYLPYLKDRQVQGQVLFPEAAFVEMALAASPCALGEGDYSLESVSFHDPLVIPTGSVSTIQLTISTEISGSASFKISSQKCENNKRQAFWKLHAAGRICLRKSQSQDSVFEGTLEDIKSGEFIAGSQHYESMELRALQYGPTFQGVQELWWDDPKKEMAARVQIPETVRGQASAYRVHPVFLDSCLQVMQAAIARTGSNLRETDALILKGFDRLHIHGELTPNASLWVRAFPRTHHGGSEDNNGGDVLVFGKNGEVAMEIQGLRFRPMERPAIKDVKELMYKVTWRPEPLPKPDKSASRTVTREPGSWIIFADTRGVGKSLAAQLQASGETCVLVFPGDSCKELSGGDWELRPDRVEDFQDLLSTASQKLPPCVGVLYLWALNSPPSGEITVASLDAANEMGCEGVLHLVQSLARAEWKNAPRLWLVTAGAQRVGANDESVAVAQSPLWGLGRVIGNEHPEFHCRLVDLGLTVREEEIYSVLDECWSDSKEDEIALRRDVRYVARLEKWSPAVTEAKEKLKASTQRALTSAQEQPFRVEMSTPGILDSLGPKTMERKAPKSGEVEIEVRATGLNFMNVMSALGIYPGSPDGVGTLGIECSGVVVAVGDGVKGIGVGDEVIAWAYDSMATHALADSNLVAPKPANLSFEQAASIPVVFLTAYYALHELGKMKRGERVLIHAAAGGVGLAAVQLAQRAGAEIFATAGSEEKRDYLRSLGIRHVMNSRSLAFADEVMALTNGEGVDIVLNSLAGGAISKGLSVLRPYGRFLELGKRDIYENSHLGLAPFRNSLSYFAIDLDRMAREQSAHMAEMLKEVVRLIIEGSLEPIPLQAFPISDVAGAFRHMAQSKHIGKIVISFMPAMVEVVPARRSLRRDCSDGTYLITGGFGALGLEVANSLVAEGVRDLVLTGRRGAPSSAQVVLDEMRKAGARVMEAKVDVSQPEQVERLFTEIEQQMPPVRAIFHAAGILDDGILLQLDQQRFRSVMAPKVRGAWNLHSLALRKPVDLFVLFSSAAALLGSPGQGNYAAANAFMDGLAQYRHCLGMPALSINWGPWSEIGLAATQTNRGGRLAFRGLASFPPKVGIEALALLLSQKEPQVAVMPFNLLQWQKFYPHAAASPFFNDLGIKEKAAVSPSGQAKTEANSIRASLLSVEPGQRRRLLFETHIQEQVAQVLKIAPSRIDLNKPLKSLGLDSLVALELRNRFEVSLGLTLPATLVWNYLNITMLATHLAERMEIQLEQPERSEGKECLGEVQPNLGDSQELDRILAEIEQLPEEEVRRRISDKLR